MTAQNPLVSVVIPTRNRKKELATAIESCLAQSYQPLEILVLDDASDDGTEAAVRESFPEVRFFREETNRGAAALKNRGFREARGEFVFGIDDDAYYTDAATVGEVVGEFLREPNTAVLALPFVEPLRDAVTASGLNQAPDRGLRLRSFVSCAYAIRRSAALESGGYREFLFYRGEERDLAVRLLDRGLEIAYVRTPPVVHLYSPKRAWLTMFPLGIRNNLLFDSLNVPQPYTLPRIAIDSLELMVYKLTPSQVFPRMAQIAAGLAACVKYARHRRPVSRATYARYRSLPSHGPAACPGEVPAPVARTSRRNAPPS